MSNFRNRYKDILKELEEHFQDEKERSFVIGKFQDLSVVFMDIIDRLTYITDMKVKEVEEKQKEIENKINSVQKVVSNIENDIYEDGEEYEFEIACPYCNYKFVEDINSNMNTEIECPECHNIIELDWNGEEECGESCSHCSHNCTENEELIYDDDEIVEEKNSSQKQKNHEDDDDKEDM